MIPSRTNSILFVCLANSYKLGGRCIAGIQIASENNTAPVLDEKGNPKWIRPVDKATTGNAIPYEIAHNIRIGDLVKVINPIPCPTYAQQENVYYDDMTVVGRLNDLSGIDLFITKVRGGLFGNYRKAVIPEKYQELSYSILLVHPQNISFYLLDRTEMNKKSQPRVKFHLSGHEYDFPITDPVYYDLLFGDLDAENRPGDYYITVSLGLEHEGFHSKLAACIIKCSNIVAVSDRSRAVETTSREERIPLPTIEDMPPDRYLSDFEDNIHLRKPFILYPIASQRPHTLMPGRMYHVDNEKLESTEVTNKDSEQLLNERRTHFESLKSFSYVVSSLPDKSDVEFFKPRRVVVLPKVSNALSKIYFTFDDKFVPYKKLGESSQVLLVKACRPIHFSICREDVVSFFLNKTYNAICQPWLTEVWKRRESERWGFFPAGASSISNWHLYDSIKLNEKNNFLTEQDLKEAIRVSKEKLNEFKSKDCSEKRLAEIVAFEKMGINFDERNDKENLNNALLSFFSFLLNNSPYAETIFAKVFVLTEQYKISEKLWKEELSRLCDFLDPKREIKSNAIESHYEYIDEAGNTIISLPLNTIGISPIIPKSLIVWITPHPKVSGKRLFTLADISGYIYYTREVGQKEVAYSGSDEKRIIYHGFDRNGIRIRRVSYMTVLGIHEENIEIEKVLIKNAPPDLLHVIALDGTSVPSAQEGILKDGRTLCHYYVITENNKRYLIAIDGRHEIDEQTYLSIKKYNKES